MVGAGPFKLVEHRPGDRTTYVRNDDYWDQDHLAKVKNLEIRVVADNVARLNAVRTGQLQATTISATQVPEIENDPAFRVLFNTELAYTYIVQNRARAQQDNVDVRRALLYGLDRQGICDSLLAGKCVITDQPFPPGYFAYNEDIDDVLYPYDPEKAKELLAGAGVESLELSMLIPGGLPTYPEIAEVIQAQWAELGVTVDIQPADPTSLGELMFAQEQADTMLAGWGGRPDPAMTFIQRAGPDAFANPGRRHHAGDGRPDRPGDVDLGPGGAPGRAAGRVQGDGRVGAGDGRAVPAGPVRDGRQRGVPAVPQLQAGVPGRRRHAGLSTTAGPRLRQRERLTAVVPADTDGGEDTIATLGAGRSAVLPTPSAGVGSGPGGARIGRRSRRFSGVSLPLERERGASEPG